RIDGYSTAITSTATTMPTSSNATKAGTDLGAMPVNVLVSERATVTAGVAKLVLDVNQDPAPMYAPTANGAAVVRPERTTPKITSSRPNVATASASQTPPPLRVFVESSIAGSENIRLARTAPHAPPRN